MAELPVVSRLTCKAVIGDTALDGVRHHQYTACVRAAFLSERGVDESGCASGTYLPVARGRNVPKAAGRNGQKCARFGHIKPSIDVRHLHAMHISHA